MSCLFISLFSIELKFDFSEYELNKNKDIFEMEDVFYEQYPGNPFLPVKIVYIIIPFGNEVSQVSSKIESVLFKEEYNIPPASENIPTSYDIFDSDYHSEVYKKNAFYPTQDFKNIGIQRKNGVDILLVQLYPFQYNPVTNKIKHNKEILLYLEFSKNTENVEMQAKKLLKFNKIENLFYSSGKNSNFYNLDALFSFLNKSQSIKSSRTSIVSSDDPYDYIIITNETLEDEWDDLVDQKQGFGLNVNVYTVEEIYANYSGHDNPERIRNFIIDAYDTWSGTENPLQWILLGGDSGIVPARQVRNHVYFSSSWHSVNIYTDNYYSCLDDDWDNDGDHSYGEGDSADHFMATGTSGEEADWFSEVSIGRASLEDSTEIANWINKSISYENLSSDTDYLQTATLIGELLNSNPYTCGGTAQDEIALYLDDYNLTKYYEMDGSFSKTGIISTINAGTNMISHLGHTSYTRVFDLYDSDVASLSNTNYCMIYSQGCRTGQYSGIDCIAESFLENEHGAFAFLGNTHWGFYSTLKDQGTSQLFNREFVDALTNENLTNLGKANSDSKEDLTGIIGSVGAMRWCAMVMSLFGDPHLSIKTDIGDVSSEQTLGNEITIYYEDTPGTGASNYANYSIYERDETDSTIAVTNCTVNGNEIILLLDDDLKEGFPYNVEISNVSGIVDPTIRPIGTLSNIIELSIITPTTWTAEKGPYYIYEDLIVHGSNLTIEAGTEIKFNEGKGIFVYDNGWLQAIGTADDQIVFTSYESPSGSSNGDWMDITFYRDADHDNCEIENCLIEYSTNGVWFDSTSTASVKNSLITHTKEYGIYSYCADPIIENVIVAYADGSDNDHGFYFEHSEPQISNIVSYGNDGYGIYLADSSNVVIYNSIIYENITGSVFLDSSIVSITYSDIEGGYSGDGNTAEDPLFEDPPNYDFTLQTGSPCIDTGDPNSTRDPDGTRADMGAIYSDHEFDFTADNMFGYDSLEVMFSDLSECEITNWSWDFENDGTYDSFEESPTFSYTQPGVYNVKMKIERAAWSDSLIKSNLIVIQGSQLDPPENMAIVIDNDDIILEWTAIDTTRSTAFRNDLYYLIYCSEDPYQEFSFLDYTISMTTYNHQNAASSYDKMFYTVIGFVGSIEELERYIETKMTGMYPAFYKEAPQK